MSRSGYYAHIDRAPSHRHSEDAKLKPHIQAAHTKSRGTYGRLRVVKELVQQGLEVGKHRVARLMREIGLRDVPQRRFRKTTNSQHDKPVAPNVLARRFEAERPNQFWTTDITYIRTWEGWLYLAVVLDLFSRRVVGWGMRSHLRTELALEALYMALGRRVPGAGLLHHSDRGVQYAAESYQDVLDDHGIICSMSRRGDCWDNAVTESFFGTLKTELVYRHPWPTRRHAKNAIADYIEAFYNPYRLHSALDYLSPMEFERLHALNSANAS